MGTARILSETILQLISIQRLITFVQYIVQQQSGEPKQAQTILLHCEFHCPLRTNTIEQKLSERLPV